MAAELATPPVSRLQSVQKVMAIPTVEAAVGHVGAFYARVKGAHSLLEWALSTAEAGVVRAATTAAPYVATPLALGDAAVAAAVDELERRVPIVAEPPKAIVEATKQVVLSRLSSQVNKVQNVRLAAVQRVKSLKELSWAKANTLLSTAYGQKAVHGVDSGAICAMQLLNYYLPPIAEEDEPSNEIVEMTNDPALHTMQTVGRLSVVAARRVWANLACKIIELRASGIEFDVRRYLTALLAALHLAKVTSQQQKKEKEDEAKTEQKDAEQAPPATPTKNPEETSPTTADVVKTTPESKSEDNAQSVDDSNQ